MGMPLRSIGSYRSCTASFTGSRGIGWRASMPGHSLQPTELLHEAYLRLVGVRQIEWRDRSHFFAMSARLMRRILVDVARSKRYVKRQRRAGLARSMKR